MLYLMSFGNRQAGSWHWLYDGMAVGAARTEIYSGGQFCIKL